MGNKSKNKKRGHKNSKSKNMRFILIIPVIVIIVIVIFILFAPKPVEASDEANAQLIIEYGTVEVRHGEGTWISAENGMFLFQSDSLKTGNNTSASVVLFKSSIIRLDSNTEITIQEIIEEEETNVKINQDSGRTWNTVRKISGIDNYEVQTPTTVASIRGTTFMVNVSPDGGTSYGVINGSINISRIENGSVVDSIDVGENESVKVDPDDKKPLETKPLEEDEWLIENQQKDEEMIQNEKENIYKKIGQYKLEIQQHYGISDQELDALIEGYLLGYYDFPPETPQWIIDLIKSP